MQIIYLSGGNIPSWWAHSYQMIKMGEALGKISSSFTFYSGCGEEEPEPSLDRIWDQYGVRSPFDLHFVKNQKAMHVGLFGYDVEPHESNQRIVDFVSETRVPDLIFTRDFSLAYQSLEKGWPVIFENHSVPTHPSIPELCHLLQQKKLLGLVTLTDFLKDHYVDQGALSDKIFPIYSGVDFSDYPHDRDRYALRKDLGLPTNQKIAIYVGSLSQHKGMELLLQTALYLPDVLFVLVGGPDASRSFWRTVVELSEVPNIIFCGTVDRWKVPDYIQAADLCLLPNDADNLVASFSFPLKVMEYLASYRPVVASRTFCLQNCFLKQCKNVFLANCNARDYANTIRIVLENTQLAHQVAGEARKDVGEYSWDKRVEKILSHFVGDLKTSIL